MSDTRASKRQKTANGRHLDVPVPQKEIEKKIEEIARPRKKRPLPKPEYEDIWESVYLSGTEWAQIDQVYDIEWDFEHLDEALTDGELVGKTVHLFGSTEPQLIMMDKEDTKGSVIPVPVIVAVDCPRPPPSMIGIKSVQRAEEEIIPMSKLKMSWHPFVPDYLSGSRRFKPNVHVLRCEQRRARLRNMSEAAVHKYDYVLPYLIRPGQEEEVEPDTDVIVDVQIERDGQEKPLMMNFDYELDDLEEFVEEQIEANDLDKDKHTDLVKTAIQKAVRAAKLKYKAEKEERKKRIEAIPQEDREAMKKLRLLKFYPQNEWPNISSVKSKYVNRYYGQADKVL